MLKTGLATNCDTNHQQLLELLFPGTTEKGQFTKTGFQTRFFSLCLFVFGASTDLTFLEANLDLINGLAAIADVRHKKRPLTRQT